MSPKKDPKDYIVYPLDVPTEAAAKADVQRMAGCVGMFKVGLELFVAAGPPVIRYIREVADAAVFLDLKLHDIPATVERTMARIADLGVALATVHCGETPRMVAAAVAGAGGKVGVLGVTVLTSVTGADLGTAGFGADYARDVARLVSLRAGQARDAGCAGVVCSGKEVEGLKARFGPAFLAVTPGIRPSWDAGGPGDQRRVTLPGEAVAKGADYLVIGRPIRNAPDPVAAARRIAGEIAQALKGQ
jgi:orotidine-5'-phosphate decarboxylase